MKFVCDSCHAQYMISDDKVGANGVKVRCKKCSNVIVVKKVVEPDPTMVMQNPLSQPAAGGPAPFDGLGTDEIGQAFDSVLTQSGPHKRLPSPDEPTQDAQIATQLDVPLAAAGAGGDSDRDSTRVVDLKAMAGLAAASENTSINDIPDAIKAQGYVDGKKNEANGHANGANGASVPQTDWYVAINEEQQGPLDLDVVKGHWEAGRVTADSLVWRNGYSDWKPLSSIPELVKVLTPIPTPRKSGPTEPAGEVRPAGATANGPQVPFVAPAPAAVPDPDEVDWKPAAASALASLVADEMEALSKPAPKAPVRAEPVGVGETTGLKPVLGNFEPPPESSSPVLESQSSPLIEAPAPRTRLPEHSPEPLVRPIPPAYPSAPDLPVYPAPSSYVPTAHNNNTKYIVAGAGVVVVCLTAVAIAYLFAGRGTPVQPQPVVAMAEPRQVQPVAPAQPAPQPAQAAPAQPAPQPVQPPKTAPEPAKTEPAKAEPARPAPAAEHESHTERVERRHGARHGGREVAAAPEPSGGDEAITAAPAKPQKPQRESSDDLLSAGGQSKVDRDFDNLLGGGSSSPEPAAPKKKHSGGDVYIPPAVSNLPEQLGQGDVMSVVAGHKGQIVGCINKQRASGGDSSGVVTMHWTIQRSGGVSGVQVMSEDFRNSPMGKCMSGIIRGWRFPQFSGAPMPIDFPFKF